MSFKKKNKIKNLKLKWAQSSFTVWLAEFQIESWCVCQKTHKVKTHLNVSDCFNIIVIQKNILNLLFCVWIFPPSWPRKWTTWSRAGLWVPRWIFSTTWGYTEEQSIMVSSHYGHLTSRSETPPLPPLKSLHFSNDEKQIWALYLKDEAMKWWSAAVACGA